MSSQQFDFKKALWVCSVHSQQKNWFRLFHRNLWSTRNKSNETNSFFCLNDSIFLRIRFYFSKMFLTKSHPFIIKFRLLSSYQLLLTFGDFKNVVFSSWTPFSHALSPLFLKKKMHNAKTDNLPLWSTRARIFRSERCARAYLFLFVLEFVLVSLKPFKDLTL